MQHEASPKAKALAAELAKSMTPVFQKISSKLRRHDFKYAVAAIKGAVAKEIGRRWPHIDSKMAADAIVAFSERGCRVEFERLTSYVLGEAAFPAPVAALAVAAP